MSGRFVILTGAALLSVLVLAMLRAPLHGSSPAEPPPSVIATTVRNEATDSVAPAMSTSTQSIATAREEVLPAKPANTSEADMMAELRATLGKGTPQATLDLARTLEKTYPDGAEAEERSLYAIDALIALNRIADMRDEARRHLAKWSGSPLSARVQARTGVHPEAHPLQ
jgi:hypothetical protein